MVSASSLKLGGGSHWSAEIVTCVQTRLRFGKFTITIELTRTSHREEGLTLIFFVRTKLALGTFRRKFGVIRVTEWKIILPTSLWLTFSSRRTEGLRVTFVPKLVCASLQTVLSLIAGITRVQRASIDEGVRREEKECERQHIHCNC